MNQENQYLNSTNFSIEQMVHAKKMAKLVVVVACIGALVGFSAGFTFFVVYKLVWTPFLAVLSGKTFYNF